VGGRRGCGVCDVGGLGVQSIKSSDRERLARKFVVGGSSLSGEGVDLNCCLLIVEKVDAGESCWKGCVWK
jgi:hypothetical protein